MHFPSIPDIGYWAMQMGYLSLQLDKNKTKQNEYPPNKQPQSFCCGHIHLDRYMDEFTI